MATKRKITDEQLRTLKTRFENGVARIEEERLTELRTARDQGRGVVELATLTGYSRETLRRILDPQVKASHNKRRTKAGRAETEDTEAG